MSTGQFSQLIKSEDFEKLANRDFSAVMAIVELGPRNVNWVSELLGKFQHSDESPLAGDLQTDVKNVVMITPTTSKACFMSPPNNQLGSSEHERLADMLGVDLNESNMSWTSSLATPLAVPSVITPVNSSAARGLPQQNITSESCFRVPGATPRVSDKTLKELGSSSRRRQGLPRTLFGNLDLIESRKSSSEEEPADQVKLTSSGHNHQSLECNVEDESLLCHAKSKSSVTIDGDTSLPVNFENSLDAERMLNLDSEKFEKTIPLPKSDISSETVESFSDDALSMFFQSPQMGAARRARCAPKQKAKRSIKNAHASDLLFSSDLSLSSMSSAELENPLEIGTKSMVEESNKKLNLDTADADELEDPVAKLKSVSICALGDSTAQNVIGDVMVGAVTENSESNIVKIPVASSVLSTVTYNTMAKPPDVMSAPQQGLCVTAASALLSQSGLVSTRRPIFMKNHSQLQSPMSSQMKFGDKPVADNISSPFAIFPSHTSTPIRELYGKPTVELSELIGYSAVSGSQRKQTVVKPDIFLGEKLSEFSVKSPSNSVLFKDNTNLKPLLSSRRPNRFIYPTAAQIAETCPKKVFSFLSKPEAEFESSLAGKRPVVLRHNIPSCNIMLTALKQSDKSVGIKGENDVTGQVCRISAISSSICELRSASLSKAFDCRPSKDDVELECRLAELPIVFNNCDDKDTGLTTVLCAKSHCDQEIQDQLFSSIHVSSGFQMAGRESIMPEIVKANVKCLPKEAVINSDVSLERQMNCKEEKLFRVCSDEVLEVKQHELPASVQSAGHLHAAVNAKTSAADASEFDGQNDTRYQALGENLVCNVDASEKGNERPTMKVTAVTRNNNNNMSENAKTTFPCTDVVSEPVLQTSYDRCSGSEAAQKDTICVGFISAGGKPLSVSSASEAKMKKMMTEILADTDCDSLDTVDFECDIMKNSFPNLNANCKINYCHNINKVNINSCQIERTMPGNKSKGFKAPRFAAKKQQQQQQHAQLNLSNRCETVDKLNIPLQQDRHVARRTHPSEISSVILTNTQMTEVDDVSRLLLEDSELLASQTLFNSTACDTANRIEESMSSHSFTKAPEYDASQSFHLGQHIPTRTPLNSTNTDWKDSDAISKNNYLVSCAFSENSVIENQITSERESRRGRKFCGDNDEVDICDNVVEDDKQLLHYVANSAFESSMEWISTSHRHDEYFGNLGFNSRIYQKDARNCIKGYYDGESLPDPVDSIPDAGLDFVIGFKTARGNSVKISSEALEKAKSILFEIPYDSASEFKPHSPTDIQLTNGNSVEISSEALERDKSAPSEISCDLATESKTCFPYGFQTANGNSVKISSEALEKAKSFLSDNSCVSASDCRPVYPTGFQTANGNSVKISSEALEKAKSLLSDNSCVSASDCRPVYPTGFQTASGNSVKISSEALEKAKSLLSDNSCVSASDCRLVYPTGFQTANGNSVKISSEALEKAKSFLSDNSCVSASDCRLVYPTGFQTAKGNSVKISSEAGKKAKSILSEISCNPAVETCFQTGSQTDKESHVRFSTEVIEVAGTIKNASQLDASEKFSAKDKGTVSNSNCEICLNNNNSFPTGFQTAKDDQISLEAFERTSDHFTDVDVDCNHMLINTEAAGRKELIGDKNSDKFCDISCEESNNLTHQPTVLDQSNEPNSNLLEAFASGQNGLIQNVKGKCFDSRDDHGRTFAVQPPNRFSDKTVTHKVNVLPDAATWPHASCFGANSFSTPYKRSVTHTDCTVLSSSATSLSSLRRSPDCDRNDFEGKSEAASVLCDSFASDKECDRFITGQSVSEKVNELRSKARQQQLMRIAAKKRVGSVRPCPGQLWLTREKACKGSRLRFEDAVEGKSPTSYSREELCLYGVLSETLSVTAANAEEFLFGSAEALSSQSLSSVGHHGADGSYLIFSEDGRLGKQEFCNALMDMPGVAPNLISPSWVFNHYRWIVWKLAAMEVAFPLEFGGRCLTPDNVLMQLKYRYDREIDHSQRSAVKKIFEHDDTSKKVLVLCVSCIINDNLLELTDGWYSIKAVLDDPLSRFVKCRRIQVGCKLCIFGSDLCGLNEATTPLEAPKDAALKICANATRLAKWHTRLGFLLVKRQPIFPIVSLFPDGGIVRCLDVVITRIYPIQFLEKLQDGSSIMRLPLAEQKATQNYEKQMEICMEKLASKFQKRFSNDWENVDSTLAVGSSRCKKLNELSSGTDIYELCRSAADPEALQSSLTAEQLELLRKQIDQEKERQELSLRECMQSMLSETEELIPKRNVSPLLKMQIAGCLWQDIDRKSQALLTIWRPSDEVLEMLKEGSRYKIFNLKAGLNRLKNTQQRISFSSINSTKYTLNAATDKNFLDLVYEPREVVKFDELERRNFRAKHEEIDIVGIVVFSTFSSQEVENKLTGHQTVYLVDENEDFLAVKFFGSSVLQDLRESLTVGQVLGFTSVHFRGQFEYTCIPCVHYSELSSVSVNRHKKYLLDAVEKLHGRLNTKNFVPSMQEKLDHIVNKKEIIESALKKLETPSSTFPQAHLTNRKVHFSGLRTTGNSCVKSKFNNNSLAKKNYDQEYPSEEKHRELHEPPTKELLEKPKNSCDADVLGFHVNESVMRNVSGIDSLDWCNDSIDDTLLQSVVDISSELNETMPITPSQSANVKQNRKRVREEKRTVAPRKSARLQQREITKQ